MEKTDSCIKNIYDFPLNIARTQKLLIYFIKWIAPKIYEIYESIIHIYKMNLVWEYKVRNTLNIWGALWHLFGVKIIYSISSWEHFSKVPGARIIALLHEMCHLLFFGSLPVGTGHLLWYQMRSPSHVKCCLRAGVLHYLIQSELPIYLSLTCNCFACVLSPVREHLCLHLK